MTKDDILFFVFALFSCLWVSFFCFCWVLFATENLSQTCLYEAERRERVWRTVGVRANEWACMMGARVLACLRAELVNTFLGTKLPRPVLWGNVQKKKHKNKNVRTGEEEKPGNPGVGFLLWKHASERSVRIRAWLLFHSKMSEATRGGDPSQASADPLGLPGVLVLHVLQSQISGRRLPDCRRETGEEEKREGRGGRGGK